MIRKGRYFRKDDSRWIENYQCKKCKKRFSSATHSPAYRQKKRRVNSKIWKLLSSTGSIRRTALLLGVDRKTVVRKVDYLGARAKVERLDYLAFLSGLPEEQKIQAVQFDEMETFERTKLLPLSLPILVQEGSRKILGFRVASMPAKGLLAKSSKKKYGFRRDDRKKEALALFREVAPALRVEVDILSDEKPQYPFWIRKELPHAKHRTVKSRKGCLVGQGELKKIGRDPLFSFNHTAAMLRANVNRLIRKTWCTTKRPDRLAAHLEIYIQFHNRLLTK